MQAIKSAQKWIIDKAHSNLEFSIKHMMISNVKGRFENFEGDVTLDLEDIHNSSVFISIDARAISTNEDDRDKHLKSPDFFNVVKYPSIEFESTEFMRNGDHVNIVGNLTIRDTTRNVQISGELQGPVIDTSGRKRLGYSGEFTIARKDFGLTWNKLLEGGGFVVGDIVNLDIHLEMVLQ